MPRQIADIFKPKLFALLSEAREMNITMVYGMQRCDARFFSFFDSARDNIATHVGLGTLTAEAKKCYMMSLQNLQRQLIKLEKHIRIDMVQRTITDFQLA